MDRQATPSDETLRPGPPTRPDGAVRIVLDTNALLDWWVFEEPAFAALPAALASGSLLWLASPAMRRELAHVLGRTALARYQPGRERTLADFDRWVQLCPDPVPSPAPSLRCRDGDDQIFIDLALRERAQWLVTRDRDLLSLARKALAIGLRIAVPEVWHDHLTSAQP